MATLTLATLKQQVAAHMDVGATDLTEAVVKELALDALRWLLPLAPSAALMSRAVYATASAGDSSLDIGGDCLKVLSVTTSAGGTHRYVEPEQFESIRKGFGEGTTSFGPGRGVWTQIGQRIYSFRDTLGLTAWYVQAPFWPPSDSLPAPPGWEGLVAIHVAMMLKLADEEYEGYGALKAQLEAQMSRFKFFSNTAPTVEG